MYKYLGYIGICLCLGCGDNSAPSIAGYIYGEPQVDSIMETFEIHADESPELYLHNPDSFLNSIPVLPETPFQKTAYANGIIFMAYTLRENGNNLESIRFYEKALNYIQDNDVVDIDPHVYIIRPLANLYVRIDDNDKAIRLLEETISQTSDLEEKNAFSIALANSYLFYGHMDRAKALLHDVIRQAGDRTPKALVYNTLASVYKVEEDSSSSVYYNDLALQEFRNKSIASDTLLWYTSALALYGELHQDHASIQQAVDLLDQHFPTSQQRVKARYALANAEVLQGKNNQIEAQEQFEKVLDLLKQEDPYTLDYTYTRALFGIAQCYEEASDIDAALYYYQWAIENDFRTQQLITGKADQLKNNQWHRQQIEGVVNLIAHRLTLLDADEERLIKQLLWCMELSKARLLINEINRSELWASSETETKQAIQHIRDLYIQLDQRDNPAEKQYIQRQIDKLLVDFQLSERYFETLSFNPTQESFFENLHRPDTDYYAYFVHQDRQISIVAHVDGRYHYHRIADTAFIKEIELLKTTYFGDSPEAYRKNPGAYRSQAQYIAQKLLPNRGNHHTNIYASLDGGLYGLPLDALWDEGFLVAKYNVAYLNSFLLFDFLPSDRSMDSRIALLYRSIYPDPLPNLDFVPREVQRIGKSFKTRSIPPDQQLDTVIRDVFAGSDVVHIAAHTLIDEEDQAPLIYLERMISTNQIRFYHMDVPLVFLSACNTGSGSALPAEGMESIQRVFLGKGVPSVISTYWFANDEVMLQLTTDFYQQLARSTRPLEALALAKRNYLAQADSEQLNPWYWANINYTGVGNEIGLEKSPNLSAFIYGLLVLPLIGLFALLRRRSRSDRSLVKINQESHN